MSAKARILLVGGGVHAEVIADIVGCADRYEIAGITDTAREVGDRFLDWKVLGRQDEMQALVERHGLVGGIVCIGDNFLREKVANEIRAQVPGFEFVKAVHPAATIGRDVEIGEGTVIMAGCIVSVGARIGRFCIVNTGSSLEHRSVMEDYSSFAAGVTTGGFFRLGRHSALALGVTAADRVSVGRNVVVGSGSLLMHDTEDDVLLYGSPARVIRKRAPGERWLK